MCLWGGAFVEQFSESCGGETCVEQFSESCEGEACVEQFSESCVCGGGVSFGLYIDSKNVVVGSCVTVFNIHEHLLNSNTSVYIEHNYS